MTFKPNSQGHNRKQTYLFDTSKNDTRNADDTSIRDGTKLKSFLTYKHLLVIHHSKKGETINLFDLLVNTVNCVGVMGRGLALQSKKRFPENSKRYKTACDRKEVQPGKMFIHGPDGPKSKRQCLQSISFQG